MLSPKTFISLICCLLVGTTVPILAQEDANAPTFPIEKFIQLNPTLPNTALDFTTEQNQSCCTKDYPTGKASLKLSQGAPVPELPEPDPFYLPKEDPTFLTECSKYDQLPQLASNEAGIPSYEQLRAKQPFGIYSFSNNLETRSHGHFVSMASKDAQQSLPTSQFHISMIGGQSLVQLEAVSHYSVCMARGQNVAMVANTDNGSIVTYNGNDHIYLAGNNTNMFTRTGGGNDVLEVFQADPLPAADQIEAFRGENWRAHRMFRTALSGGKGDDTVVMSNTPAGTKWCFIGGYTIFGEYFYVVEFALPPSVTEGPRRQRVNIGQSVEYVVFRGQKYTLRDFLVHGQPMDAIARSLPPEASLPN